MDEGLVFDPGINELSDFADFVEETISKPCPDALAWLRKHDWTNVDEAPYDFAYFLLMEYLDVLGPIFRAGTIERLGSDPFWACNTWVSIAGLTDEEYHYLFSRWFFRYRHAYGKKVEDGSIGPGSRAIVRVAAGRGRL